MSPFKNQGLVKVPSNTFYIEAHPEIKKLCCALPPPLKRANTVTLKVRIVILAFKNILILCAGSDRLSSQT